MHPLLTRHSLTEWLSNSLININLRVARNWNPLATYAVICSTHIFDIVVYCIWLYNATRLLYNGNKRFIPFHLHFYGLRLETGEFVWPAGLQILFLIVEIEKAFAIDFRRLQEY